MRRRKDRHALRRLLKSILIIASEAIEKFFNCEDLQPI